MMQHHLNQIEDKNPQTNQRKEDWIVDIQAA